MKKTEVINFFGSASKLAEVLDISPASISCWSDQIPEKRAMQIERITKGALVYLPELYKKPVTATAK
ncbi:TPA: Cro/CI family transcriptional regulator [Yersinia enterocolitica]